jgi:peptide/nickel transport system permease protein
MSGGMVDTDLPPPGAVLPGPLRRAWDSDLAWAFRHSPTAIVAAAVLLVFLVAAAVPDLVAPYRVFDLRAISLRDAFVPPLWMDGGKGAFPLGTDDQGRDLLSAIVYGLRASMIVGLGAVVLGLALGIPLGLAAGFLGGAVDAVIMRIADVQLTFPPILVAVIIDGIMRTAVGAGAHEGGAWVLVGAIGLSAWVQYARVVRGATLAQKDREYVQAARLIGLPSWRIVVSHILPNVLTAVPVLATIQLAVSIILEATLSFVGLGIPPTQPSLGTLIRIGNGFLLSGEWWIAIFPGAALVVLVVAINLLGDWLRDALNPRLR